MISQRDIGWVAAFIEGEGHMDFHANSLRLNAGQCQLWPLEKLRDLFGGRLSVVKRGLKNPRHKDFHRWEVSGQRAAGIIFMIYPLMSPERKARIRRAVAKWKSRQTSVKARVFCLNGHPLTGDNLYKRGGKRPQRVCITCQNSRVRNFMRSAYRGRRLYIRNEAAALLEIGISCSKYDAMHPTGRKRIAVA